MTDDTLNEGSTGWLTVEFKDRLGVLGPPTTASYQIDCLTTGQVVRISTPLSAPGGTVELMITPSDTVILNATNRIEIKRITVTSQFGVDDAHNEEFEYRVKNLQKV